MIAPVERRWVIWFAVIVMILTSVPYLLVYLIDGNGWQYSGLLMATEDVYSYLSKMALGSYGNWLFQSPYSVFPQQFYLIYIPYILLGKLAGGTDGYTQRVVLFHIFRFAGGIFSIWATYTFCSVFIETPAYRRLAVILSVFGGGLGFLVAFGQAGLWQGVMKMPLEFYSPEALGFLQYLALPHLLWARGLLLLGLVAYLTSPDAPSEKNWLIGVKIGLLWLLMGLIQPLTIVSGWAVMGMTVLFQSVWLLGIMRKGIGQVWPWVVRAVCAGLVSAPIVLYNLLSFAFDPFLAKWQEQNLVPSPPPGDYLLAWAVLLPLVLLGMWRWRSKLTLQRLLLLAWLVVFPFLAYFPHNMQRRLVEGSWVVGCVVAVAGLSTLAVKFRRPAFVWISMAFLSTAVLFSGAILGISQVGLPLFRPEGEVQAMNFLNSVSKKNDIVMASYATSNILPARAPVRVPIGLGVESVADEPLREWIEDFYSAAGDDAQRQGLLDDLGVRFVFWGPLERDYGNYDPSSLANLREIYNANGYLIFEVETEN